jgi:NAD(P)H-nitrite reductase large subunit
MRYVILGNSIAAIGAVEALRQADRESPITIFSKEPYPAYGRPLIASFLSKGLGEEQMLLRPPHFYEENGIELLLGVEAQGIEAKKKKVLTKDGKKVPFDRLLIATGGSPILPQLPGIEGEGVFTFNTLEDAKTLDLAIPDLKEVVVIGGGLIGLKAAESLHDRGVLVKIVELAPRILSLAFDDQAARIISRRLQETGIQIYAGTTAEAVERRGEVVVVGVTLKSGKTLTANGVVVAVGVAPNTGVARGTPIEVRRGIVVNGFMETSVPGIYAAGDVAEARDWHFSTWRVVPIWPNAYRQGRVAGRNMAGGEVSFQGSIPMNSISFYGIPTISVGVTNPPEEGYETISVLDQEKNSYRKLVLQDGKLVGFVLVGQIKRAGILTGLIRDRMPVGEFAKDLLAEDLNLYNLPKALRQERLGVPSMKA